MNTLGLDPVFIAMMVLACVVVSLKLGGLI